METKVRHINGVNIAYYESGNSSGITVVFLHGFPFNKDMWSEQIAVLKEKYNVLAMDFRGHGASETGEDNFSIDLFANDLVELVQSLAIQKAVLCGLSMGGYVALNAITRFPELFSGLILCDTNCVADLPQSKEKRMKTIQDLPSIGMKTYAAESVKNLFAEDSFKNKPKQVKRIQNIIEKTSETTIVKTLMALANRRETCSELHKIKVPTLILVGEKDVITPLSAAEMMWENITDSELFVIEKAGHVSNLENTEEFNQDVLQFLEKHF